MDSGSGRHRLAAAALRAGVALSFAFLLAGIVSSVRGGGDVTQLAWADVPGLPAGIARFEASALVHAGVLTLLATPMVRVAALLAGFLARKDGLFAAATFCILLLLVVSLVVGFR